MPKTVRKKESKKSTKKKSTKKKTTAKKKMPGHAWNKVEFDEQDWSKFDAILQFQPTLACCEELMGYSHDAIERNIRRKFDLTFSEYRNRKMGKIRLKLKQKVISKALDGDNPSLRMALSNLCGWSEKVTRVDDIENDNANETILLKYSLDD